MCQVQPIWAGLLPKPIKNGKMLGGLHFHLGHFYHKKTRKFEPSYKGV